MGSIASLNIRIGADLAGLRRDLQVAERTLKQTASRLSSIGAEMSRSITAPMAILGGISVKVAGEMESLRLAMQTTFEDAGRSVAESRVELENLRKSALAPGLDFEQAVKASIRLQNVGFSAEKARRTIEELANAVAMSGGTAEDLGEVTNQFSQMIGKGKILNEDLKIIMGRMPKLAVAMKEAFGTVDAEQIRAQGVSAQEFVERITEKLAEMPRVSGGISNAIVNATSSVRQFLATVGEDLNKSLNLQKVVEDFSGWLDDLAARFRALSPETKEMIVKVGLFVAALGPAALAISAVLKVSAALSAGWLAMRIATLEVGKAFVGMGAWIGQVRTAFLALNLATQVTALGLIITAVAAAVVAWQHFKKELSNTEKVKKTLADVSVQAEQSIVSEKLAVERLIKTLNDENASREDKARALKELKAVSPDYFGQLKIENGQVLGLTKAYDDYTVAILRSAKAKAAQEKLVEIQKQLLDTAGMAAESEATWGQTIGNFFKSGGSYFSFAAKQAQSTGNNYKENQNLLEQQAEALAKMVEQNGGIETSANKAAAAYKNLGKSAGGAAGGAGKPTEPEFKNAGLVNNALDMANAYLQKSLEKRAELTKQKIHQDVLLGAPALLPQVGEWQLPNISTALQASLPAIEAVRQGVSFVSEELRAARDAAVVAGDAVMNYAQQGGASMKEFAKTALGSIAKVIRGHIMEGIAGYVAKVMGTSPFGLFLAPAAGAAAGVVFNSLLSKVGIPALADGGVATSPTLAMIGEYPGASTNPEVVAPLSKLQNMLDLRGGNDVHLVPIITADQLFVMVQRGKEKRERFG